MKNSQFRQTTLFDYVAKKQEEETAVKTIKKQVSNIRLYYLKNLFLSLGVILSVCLVFYVQFRTDMLQDRVDLMQSNIESYEEELTLLSVEWNYLTRPERLRFLSKKYIKENKGIAFYQVKNYQKLQEFSLANLRRLERRNVNVSLIR